MSDVTLLVLGAVIGIPTGILASWLYDILKSMKRQRAVAIEGSWAELVQDSAGRQYSLGHIYFDQRRKMYAFDGTNYQNDGTPFCHWETVASHLDQDTREFFYTFVARVENELDRRYYGFGVVNLAPNAAGALVPTRGHYVSANVDGRSMSHSMLKSDQISYSPTIEGKQVITFVESSRASAR